MVASNLQPDCWPAAQRGGVLAAARALVLSTWGTLLVAGIGVGITYNVYPRHQDLSSWEARCECVAAALCCRSNVVRRPDGKRPPLTNIVSMRGGARQQLLLLLLHANAGGRTVGHACAALAHLTASVPA